MAELKESFEKLLPHRSPALLVTAVAEHSDDAISCFGRIPSEHPSVCNGFAPSTMAVEFAAQAAGVWMAFRHLLQNPNPPAPRLGYLVSLKDVRIDEMAVPADCPLCVEAKVEATFGQTAMFFVRVHKDNHCVVEGHLGVAAP